MASEAEFLRGVLKDHEAAVRFVQVLGSISQTLDDLVDGDKATPKDRVVATFWDALVELPSNPFYREYFQDLQPLLRQVFLDWTTANALERGDDQAKALAYVLRDSLVGVVQSCALLIGGFAWAKEVGPAIRNYFHDEPLAAYIAERGQGGGR